MKYDGVNEELTEIWHSHHFSSDIYESKSRPTNSSTEVLKCAKYADLTSLYDTYVNLFDVLYSYQINAHCSNGEPYDDGYHAMHYGCSTCTYR